MKNILKSIIDLLLEVSPFNIEKYVEQYFCFIKYSFTKQAQCSSEKNREKTKYSLHFPSMDDTSDKKQKQKTKQRKLY